MLEEGHLVGCDAVGVIPPLGGPQVRVLVWILLAGSHKGQPKSLASVAGILSSRCYRSPLATPHFSLPQRAEPERCCPSRKNLSQTLDLQVVLKLLFGERSLWSCAHRSS